MARLATTFLAPHLKPGAQLDGNDYLLFPDAAHDLPDDVEPQEKAWMLKLDRLADPE